MEYAKWSVGVSFWRQADVISRGQFSGGGSGKLETITLQLGETRCVLGNRTPAKLKNRQRARYKLLITSAHVCSKIFISSWSFPHPGTKPVRSGAVWSSPVCLDASRCFYAGSPCADISEGASPRSFSSAHQIKRKTAWMTSANLTITAPQRGFTFLG